jgi:hypothetical protein
MENTTTKIVLIGATLVLAAILLVLFFAQGTTRDDAHVLGDDDAPAGAMPEVTTEPPPRDVTRFDFEQSIEITPADNEETEGEVGGVFRRDGEDWLHYENQSLGLSFEFRRDPLGYVLLDARAGEDVLTASGRFFMLVPEREYRDLVAEPQPNVVVPNISIAIYPIEPGVTAREWVERDSRSNFTLADGFSDTAGQVGGKNLVSYSWATELEHDTVVVAHDGKAYVFSVTYASSGDRITEDFRQFLLDVVFLTSR